MGAVASAVWRALNGVRRWLREFRRTRPFWGGLWTILAGAWIIHAMSFTVGITLTGAWTPSAGYVMGAGLVLFGLVAWLAPYYKPLAALVTFLLSLAAFPTANAGGYLLGTLLGLLGSAMVASWGPKGMSRRQRRKLDRARHRFEEAVVGDAPA